MKKELPHYFAVLVFHFFYCREKKKNIYLLLIHFFFCLNLYTQKTERKFWDYIPTYFFQRIFSRATSYVKPMCCFQAAYVISVKPYWLQQPVSCRKTKSHSFIFMFCFTLALYHELQGFFCFSHILYKHGYMVALTTNENYKNADSAIQAPNFDVSHYLHKPTRCVLHCIWL